jgi:hypothetical protein
MNLPGIKRLQAIWQCNKRTPFAATTCCKKFFSGKCHTTKTFNEEIFYLIRCLVRQETLVEGQFPQ